MHARLPHPKGRGDSLRTSPLHTDNTQAYLSSLSSRLTSFFCFRVSSRLRRASASSLTARSRSRLRLSHSVLVEKGEVKVTAKGTWSVPHHLSAPIPQVQSHQTPRPAHHVTKDTSQISMPMSLRQKVHVPHTHPSSTSFVAVERPLVGFCSNTHESLNRPSAGLSSHATTRLRGPEPVLNLVSVVLFRCNVEA